MKEEVATEKVSGEITPETIRDRLLHNEKALKAAVNTLIGDDRNFDTNITAIPITKQPLLNRDIKEERVQRIKIHIQKLSDVIKTKTKTAISSVSNHDYSAAIDALQEARDASLGISWKKSQSTNGKDHYLVRDARYASSDPELHADNPISYQIAAINNARAAVRILKQENRAAVGTEAEKERREAVLTASIELINKSIEVFFQEEGAPKIKEFNGKLIAILEANSVNNPEDKMKFVKEVAQLEDTQYHVATITMQYDTNYTTHNMVEVDTLLLGLTDQQKKEYEAIQQGEKGPKWYQQAPDWMKLYVKEYANQVPDKTLPTQLRQYPFSGLRNAYEKTTYVDDKEVQRNLHSASLSFHGQGSDPGSKIEVVKENIMQLVASQPRDQAIILSSLTSPPAGLGKLIGSKDVERGAYKDVKQALEELKTEGKLGDRDISVVSNPLNLKRNYGLSITDQKAFDDTLKNIGSGLRDKQAIAKYLQTGKGLSSARRELNSLDPDQKTVLQHAIDAKKNINKTFFPTLLEPLAPLTWVYNAIKGIFFGKNQNAEVMVSMSALSDAIHCMDQTNALFKDGFQKTQVPIIEKFCASGKDRTGQHQEDGTAQAITDYLQVIDSKLQRLNQELQVSGGHQQLLAGMNGGTQGAHGLKDEGFGGYHRDSKVNKIDNSKTSKLNNFKHEEMNESVKQNLTQPIRAALRQVDSKSQSVDLYLETSPLNSEFQNRQEILKQEAAMIVAKGLKQQDHGVTAFNHSDNHSRGRFY